MKTYGRIASMPNSWLMMQYLYKDAPLYSKAIASFGVPSDVFSFNAFAAVRASSIQTSQTGENN